MHYKYYIDWDDGKGNFGREEVNGAEDFSLESIAVMTVHDLETHEGRKTAVIKIKVLDDGREVVCGNVIADGEVMR